MPHIEPYDSQMLLIQTAIAGDKQAFGQLYDIFAGQIFRYLFFHVGEHSAAKDMTEDVFLKAWEHLPGFGKSGRGLNFRAWLYRIAHNAVIDHYRGNKNEIPIDAIPGQSDGSPPVVQLIEQAEKAQALMKALDGLEKITRQVVVLRFYSGLNPAEIADVMGLSEGNVRIIQYRGLKKLREIMGADDER